MSPERPGRFYFVGERLCVDFVNTEILEGGKRLDLLAGFDDLVDWFAAAHVIGTGEAGALARRWGGTSDAQHTFQRAVRFRATVRGMLEPFSKDRRNLSQQTLDAINSVLGLSSSVRELVRTRSGYETRWRRSFAAPEQLLVPVAESAADLLSTDDLTLVKKCESPHCILLFCDTSKNHARRWCSMAACGNRAKAAAHYRRTREHRSRTGRDE